MAKLFWLQPDNSIVEFPLKAERSLIGRSSRCDVCIKHPGISAEHALIRQVSGAATVEDLDSTNGTRVNGTKLIQMHTLRHGDQIGVGRERLMYFAELDSAANFMQPESIEPFAILAPVRERVNTESDPGLTAAVMASLTPPVVAPARRRVAPAPLAAAAALTWAPCAHGLRGDEPLLDISLLAALPMGTTLGSGGAPMSSAISQPTRAGRSVPPRIDPSMSVPVAGVATPTSASLGSPRAPTPQTVVGSVAVLSGPAAGKRYPLTQTSVSLGKEGKQVVEFVRAGLTSWQIRQREGVTPAYINGDALEGVHDLAAGDVIEMTGVRLRFEISLTPR